MVFNNYKISKPKIILFFYLETVTRIGISIFSPSVVYGLFLKLNVCVFYPKKFSSRFFKIIR